MKNNEARLFIATNPSESSDELKKYSEIEFITELKHNYSNKKEDRIYLHNKGQTTSITTGITQSLSVSIDFDNSIDSHHYLLTLLLGSIENLNNQYIRIEIPTISKNQDSKYVIVQGKATINFKNHLPSGNADETEKLSFDILPQDYIWEVKESA
ncbi:hypothetical protein FCL74_02790 [Mycoplasma bovis]|nr:hypothetical protein [Mycoplasmopsis bovis]MBT1328238.1 hypothetical protein [Mycoplasmopsis bovis]MBT1332767.1 hypothetical protein [Mycoplasmopsis bovis]